MGNIPVVARDLEDGRFTTLLCEAGHAIVADEPVALGGLGLGPDPYDLLLMALGACTSMTLRLYAKRKSLPLERVEVELTHGRIHADDCGACETDDVQLERIERRIALHGPLTAEQRASLLDIADRCPVYRTLSGKIVIVSSLREQAGTSDENAPA
jgi:putative redox protein